LLATRLGLRASDIAHLTFNNIDWENNTITLSQLKTGKKIELQIWVSLIIQLIMLVIQRKAQKSWAYSNMVSVIRYHLMTYIDLFKFIKDPDSEWEKLTIKPSGQLLLFGS